jgi:hypothetical protein
MKSITIGVTMPVKTADEVVKRATKLGLSKSAYCAMIIKQRLELV